eukprot:gene30375-36702_t
MSANTEESTPQGTSNRSSAVPAVQEEESLESLIAKLKEIGQVEASKKKAGLSTQQLKRVAQSFNIRKDQNKEVLVRLLFERFANEAELDALEAPPVAGNGGAVSFHKTPHTIPRIAMIMTRYPVAIMSMELQGTRDNLQRGHTYGNMPVFTEMAAEFNSNVALGGVPLLVQQHDAFKDHNGNPIYIDPEFVHPVPITSDLLYNYLKKTLAAFRRAYNNYWNSGINNDHDFWNYCAGNLDVMFFYLVLKACNNVELFDFCSEGNVLQRGQGVDTAAAASTTRVQQRSTADEEGEEGVSVLGSLGSPESGSAGGNNSSKKRKSDGSQSALQSLSKAVKIISETTGSSGVHNVKLSMTLNLKETESILSEAWASLGARKRERKEVQQDSEGEDAAEDIEMPHLRTKIPNVLSIVIRNSE